MGVREEQQRRIKTATVYPVGLTCEDNEHKWYAWVKTNKASNVMIRDYYLGRRKPRAVTSLTDKEEEFILREIFLDGMDNGALNLSEKVNPNDFSFHLGRHCGNEVLTVDYAPKGVQHIFEGIVNFHAYYCLNKGKLGEAEAVLHYMGRAIHDCFNI